MVGVPEGGRVGGAGGHKRKLTHGMKVHVYVCVLGRSRRAESYQVERQGREAAEKRRVLTCNELLATSTQAETVQFGEKRKDAFTHSIAQGFRDLGASTSKRQDTLHTA